MPGLEKAGPRALEPPLPERRRRHASRTSPRRAGVAGRGYDLGVATGDYDNDGDTDIFVAGLRRNTLFRNDGDGTFKDVTEAAGLAQAGPAVRHAVGGGGRLRRLRPRRPARPVRLQLLRVGPGHASPSAATRSRPTTATRSSTQGLPNSLFRNNGDGHLHRRVRGRRASAPTSARGWGSGSPTSTATAGPTSSWPTTPCRRSCS